MSYTLIGLLSLLCGLIGFVIKENAVRHRVKLYSKLTKTNNPEKIKEAEKSYRTGIIIFSSFLILFGLWLLLK